MYNLSSSTGTNKWHTEDFSTIYIRIVLQSMKAVMFRVMESHACPIN